MKQRNTMKLWQMLLLGSLLLAVTISMFLPILRIKGTKIVEAIQKEFGMDSLGEWINWKTDEYESQIKQEADEIDQIVEEGEEVTGVQISSLSGISFIMMDTNALFLGKDYTKEELERAENEDFIKIKETITRYKVLLAIAYFGAVVILILILLSYFLNWSKYIMAIISSGFGLIVSVIFAIWRWGIPEKLIESFSDGVEYGINEQLSKAGLVDLFNSEEMIELTVRSTLKAIMGIGIMTCFVLGILVFVMGIITCIVGRVELYMDPIPRPEPFPTPTPFPGPNPFPPVPPQPQPRPKPEPKPEPPKPKAGQVKCTQGVAMGQGFKLPEDRKVIVGKSPQNATLVIHDQHISNVHCSIRYRAETNSYIVKDHSTNGTFVQGVRLAKEMAMEYPAGTVLSLADGSNKITLG